MPSNPLVERARQGDPDAIAALINRSLKGVTAEASRSGDFLEIALTAPQVPAKQTVAPFVRKGVERLGLNSISQVRISGQADGASSPAWTEEFSIGGSPSPAVTRSSPSPVTKQSSPPPRKAAKAAQVKTKQQAAQANSPGCLNDIFSQSGCAVTIIGVIVFFVNPGIGFWMFMLGVVMLLIWLMTPAGRAFQRAAEIEEENKKKQAKQAEENKKKRVKQAVEQAKAKVQALQQDPGNQDLWQDILETLESLPEESVKLGMSDVVVPFIRIVALDDHYRSSVALRVIKCLPTSGLSDLDKDTSQQMYDLALEILETYPDQPAFKVFVLQIGRWHFGNVRGGQATIYDEQAIQNDILVRAK